MTLSKHGCVPTVEANLYKSREREGGGIEGAIGREGGESGGGNEREGGEREKGREGDGREGEGEGREGGGGRDILNLNMFINLHL